jgi:hypothetical protein
LGPALGLPLVDRLAGWLERRGIEQVELAPVALETLDDRAAGVREAAQLTWWTPYDAPGQVLTLVRHLVDTVDWVDVRELLVAPLGTARAYRCEAVVLGYDPRGMFRGAAATACLRDPASSSDALDQAVEQALERTFEALDPQEQEAFQEGLRNLCDTAFGVDHALGERFAASLAPATAELVQDARLVWDLRRSHGGLIDRLDDWLQRDRIDADGRVTGVRLHFPVWGRFQSSYGADPVPELQAEPAAAPDPQALLARASDRGLPDSVRRAATDRLLALRDPAALPAQVALLGRWPRR